MQSQNGSIWKSVAYGAVGGAVASYVMNQFGSLSKKAVQAVSDEPEHPGEEQKGDDATVKTARSISRGVFGKELSPDQKKWAGPAVHYGLGTVLGALYGALAVKVPLSAIGFGTVYGGAVWLGADEIAVPAFKLSKPPGQIPASSHASALASHLVYGVVTDGVRRGLLALESSVRE